MATTETTVSVHARSTHHRDRRFLDGIDGTEPEYGVVEVVRTTTTQRYAEESTKPNARRHGRNRIGTPEETVEVLAVLTAEEAVALSTSLAKSVVRSLRVAAPFSPHASTP